RSESSLHDRGLEFRHLCLPRASERAQSSKSPRCAKISPADLDPLATLKSLKSAGAPRRTLAPPSASLATLVLSGRFLFSPVLPGAIVNHSLPSRVIPIKELRELPGCEPLKKAFRGRRLPA